MESGPKNNTPERKISRYSRLLNPENTLPVVSIREDSIDPIEEEVFHLFSILDKGGLKIGMINLVINEGVDRHAEIDLIELLEEFRGQGYGRSSYISLLEYLDKNKIPFRSGNNLSKEAKGVWDWMVDKGVAQQTVKGSTNSFTEERGISYDEYEIIQ